MGRHLFSKILSIFLILIILFSAAVYFFAKPVLLQLANKELRKIFRESSVGGLRITKNFIEFQDIKIRQEGFYDFKIKEARAYYYLDSLFEKKIERVLLNGVSAKINMVKNELPGLYPFPASSVDSKKFSVVKFEATDVNLDLSKDDIKLRGAMSIQLDIPTNLIDYVKLNIASIRTNLFEIGGMVLIAEQNQSAGEFYIEAVNYDKLKIGGVLGKTELRNNILRIRPLMVNFLGGTVKGDFTLSLDSDMNYSLDLLSQGLEIKKLVDEMKFNEKFDMTGRAEGKFSLSGKVQEIKGIKGNFHTDINGGLLVIKDKTFLENVAKQSNQSLDIIVESFRNYNYNNGIINLGIDSGNLVMDVELDGKSGKRSLTVVLHDFKKGKDEL